MSQPFAHNPLSDEAKEVLREAFKSYMDEHAEELANLPPEKDAEEYEREVCREIARLYDCLPWHVAGAFNPEYELKPITARRVLRAHIEHIKAKQRGELLKVLPDSGKYKGKRSR
jgi:hypothetical protein